MARCTSEEGAFRCARQAVGGSTLCAEHIPCDGTTFCPALNHLQGCGAPATPEPARPAPDVEVEAEAVDHPAHYGGADDPYEAIKVIRAWGLGFNLGNTVKYISRAGKKDPTKTIEDLKKALWYLNDEIAHLEAQTPPRS